MTSEKTSEKNKRPLYIPYAGSSLLETPLLNKGSALAKKSDHTLI
jgi:malate dehydrogenase (oxaloacetate-decarboxylating)